VKTTIRIGGTTRRMDAPDGYRRVSNGYTRPGDLRWCGMGWVSVEAVERVSTFAAVLRPVGSTAEETIVKEPKEAPAPPAKE
jgi:hypothetical protein